MREYPDQPIAAVCATVTRNDEILLVRRGIEPNIDFWVMPGGVVKLGERLAQVAERETLEETGIVVKAGTNFCTLDFMEKDPEGKIKFHFVIFYFRCTYVAGDAQGGSDAREARWVHKTELEHLSLTPNGRRVLKTLHFLP